MNKIYFCLSKVFCLPIPKLLLYGVLLTLTGKSLQAQSVTITPTADAYIRNGTYGATNYGSDTSLVVKGSGTTGFSRLAYLKFSLGSITDVRSAKIRLFGSNIDNTTTINVALYSLSDDTWTETGITFNNAPASPSAYITSTGINNVPGYYEFDVTNFVKAQLAGDKIVSFFIKDSTKKNVNIIFNSNQHSKNTPQLVVDITPLAGPVALAPAADAYVRNGTHSNSNFGSDTSLTVKSTPSVGLTRLTYLKFSLGSVNFIRSAKIRLYGANKDNTATLNVPVYGLNDDSWTETGITFNNAPPPSMPSLNTSGINSVPGYYEYDVTDFVKAQFMGDKVAGFVLRDSANKNINITFNSKENSKNPPQLVIDTAVSNAVLFVENMDGFPSNDHVVFSRLQVPWTRDSIYNGNHDSIKVRIHNNGINPLIISNLKISVDSLWKIDKFNGSNYNPLTQLPATIAPGGIIDLMVKFTAKNIGSSGTRVKVLHQTLTISSNDDKYPIKKIFLHGLWQYSGEGTHEPYSQEILSAFGYKTQIGFTDIDPDLGDSTKLKGDEINPGYFLRADTILPVIVTQLAAYHGCCHSTETFKWFSRGSTSYKSVFTHIGLDAQALLPRKSTNGTIAGGTFTPPGIFGVSIGVGNTTSPALNSNKKFGVRVYKALDASGNIIPNSYILASDYLGSGSNYDYNDNLYFVSNIKPFAGTVYYSPLNVAPSNLDFGERILQTKDSLLVNISNGGKTYSNGTRDPSLMISSVVVTGENKAEFSADMPLISTLTPQQATILKVRFNPTSPGLKIADLLIYYNNSQVPKRVPLYGIAKLSGTTVTAKFRINSGASSALTINGKTWAADNQYSFDNLEPYKNAALKQIAGTDEDILYLDEQSSNGDKKPFRYQFPVANGTYYVRLHFAEIYWGAPGLGLAGGAGSRTFSIKLENDDRLVNLDITMEVGAATAVIKNFPVTVTDGNLNIDFSATINRPVVNAVEIYNISTPAARTSASATLQNDTMISINNQAIISSFHLEKPGLYPNPSGSKNFNIAFPAKYNGTYNLQLSDILGKTYELGNIKVIKGGSQRNVDISRFSLNPGVYFLQISSISNKADVIKLVIR